MAEPPAPAIGGFVNGDAINPGLQTRLAVEVPHSAEDFEENFLRGVGGIRGVGQNAIDQAIDGLVELSDEPGIGLFRPGLKFCNNTGLFAAYGDRARKITHVGNHDPHRDTSYYRSAGTALLTSLDPIGRV